MDSEVCECIDGTWGGPPGESCATWNDCAPVCCDCPGTDHHYTAAVCDLSAGSGICADADRTCGLTKDRCALGAPARDP